MAAGRNGDDHMETRIDRLEDAVDEIRKSTNSIAQSLATLSNLETQHAETRNGLGRAFKNLEDHEARLRTMETEMPTMKMTRNWVIAGFIGIVSIFTLLLVQIAFKSVM